MNGQQSAEQAAAQSARDAQLSYLLNSANAGQGALMGLHGAGAGAALLGAQRFGLGGADANLEEQILQRASALRAEALMQQQQQQAHQRQHHLGAALAALQQQQQLATLAGLNPAHLAALGAQDQEALLARTAALRELALTGGAGALPGVGMDRLQQQLELGRLEEMEQRRQLAALAGLTGAANAQPAEVPSGADQLNQDSIKSETAVPSDKAAAPATEKNTEELKKKPGTVIVPCRARGMPMDHNFKTEEAKHGEDLVCSYFACRNGGVKFRYCAYCMAPVAKRNFCRRHDHGMSAKNGESKVEDDDDASMEDAAATPVKKEVEAPESEKKAQLNSEGGSLDVLSNAASKSAPEASVDSAKRKQPSQDDEELANISKKRRKLWSALLLKRPRTRDPRHLSSWLNEVLTVSDFETPLEQSDEKNPSKKQKADKGGDGGSGKKDKKKKKTAKPTDSENSEKKANKESPVLNKNEKSEKTAEALNEDANSSNVAKEEAPKNVPEEKVDVPKDDSTKKEAVSDGGEGTKTKDEAKQEVPSVDGGEKNGSDEGKAVSIPSNGDKSPVNATEKEDSPQKDDEEGFVGSFTAWRDRKKDKALKKGPGSLKK